MLNRAYSLLEIKEVSSETDFHVIRGMATTPTADRINDIVDPLGARFAPSMPLLWQHQTDKPVGHAEFGKPTKNGIPFTARLPIIKEAGALKDRVEEAIQSIKYRLVGAVSIGFRVLNDAIEHLKNGGMKFLETEIMELSLVTIPANAEATITSIKSLDSSLRAASGDTHRVVRLDSPAGVSASTKALEGKQMNISEQLKSFESKRTASSERMVSIMTKAGDDGRTLDATETEEHDTLQGEVKSIDEHLVRLRSLEKMQASTAKPIDKIDTGEKASKARGSEPYIQIKDNLPPGIEFARYAMCLATSFMDHVPAYDVAKQRYPDQQRIHNVLKTAVAGGTTTDATWASPLALADTQFVGDFVEFLRPQTIVGKFGANGIPSLRRIPFNVSINGQTSGGTGYWVGQGAPKPVTKFDFARVTMGFTKVANIAVITQELARFSNPAAETQVRDSLAGALIERIDFDFVDPGKAEVAGVSPASITNGVVAIGSSGTDSGSVRVDIAALFAPFIAANNAPSSGVWIMSATTALALSLMQNPLGQPEFANISMTGGSLFGLPVIVSEYMGDFTSGGVVILVNASDIWLADDGGVKISVSDQASLQMDDAPTNNSATPTATSLVSLWQTDSIGIRAERFINWKKRRASAVAYLDNVAWSASNQSL